MLLKVLILLLLLSVGASLFTAAYHLTHRGDQSAEKFARALTWRIGLSLLIFVIIVTGCFWGWLTPHGLGS